MKCYKELTIGSILKPAQYMQNLFSNEILIGLPLKFRYVKKKLPFSQLIKYYYKLILREYNMSLFITFKCEASAAINTSSPATPSMSSCITVLEQEIYSSL